MHLIIKLLNSYFFLPKNLTLFLYKRAGSQDCSRVSEYQLGEREKISFVIPVGCISGEEKSGYKIACEHL